MESPLRRRGARRVREAARGNGPTERSTPRPESTSPLLALSSAGRVILQSRQERTLTRHFPEVVDAVGQLRAEVVLDGELVLWRDGRLNFEALQRRLTPTRRTLNRSPDAPYVVFDVLAFGRVDLRSRPYKSRRSILELLLRGGIVPSGLVLAPMSTEHCVAQAWLINHSAAGIEGSSQAHCPALPLRPAWVAQDPDEAHCRGCSRWRDRFDHPS